MSHGISQTIVEDIFFIQSSKCYFFVFTVKKRTFFLDMTTPCILFLYQRDYLYNLNVCQ